MSFALLNFRDLGGLKGKGGRKVLSKRLLRSAQPVGLSEEIILHLKEHNLAHIIDFRTVYEVETEPVDKIEGVNYTHLDVMGINTAQTADPNMWVKIFLSNPNGIDDEFNKIYKDFVVKPLACKGYSEFIKLCINQREGAVLFHCAAGKDRTGFGAALILRLLGVSDEDIYEDFLKSLAYQNEMKTHYLNKSKEVGLTAEQIEAMHETFLVKREYLALAFETAVKEYGSFEKYVEDCLKLTGDDIRELQELYLS